MSKDRIEPCKYYECFGQCNKGREADLHGYCQRCDKYEPRAKRKHKNQKKEKLRKIRDKEWRHE